MKNQSVFISNVVLSTTGSVFATFITFLLLSDAGSLTPIQSVCLVSCTGIFAMIATVYTVDQVIKWNNQRRKKKRPLPGQLSPQVKAHMQRRKGRK